jgi:hypothetical protein
LPTGCWLALHAASSSVPGRSTRSLDGSEVYREMDAPRIDEKAFDLLVNSFPWGYANELPDEVLNTCANILYRALEELTQSNRCGLRDGEEINAESWLNAATRRNRIAAEAEMLPQLIDSIRKLPRETDDEIAMYEYLVQHFLDEFKYRIDCDNKTPIERERERKLIRPDEIPNLFELLSHARSLLSEKRINN